MTGSEETASSSRTGVLVYIAIVLAQTLVLPLVSAIVHLLWLGGDPLLVFALWWAFWGVGTRLTLAGLSQIANPERTSRDILGGSGSAGANQVVHELGFANLSMGVVALVAPFLGGWAMLGAAVGALYLGLAGVRHLPKRGKNGQETVAMWTDLLVFVVVTAGVVRLVVG